MIVFDRARIAIRFTVIALSCASPAARSETATQTGERLARELSAVRSAIRTAGAIWVAEPNPISRLPPAERVRLSGVLAEDGKPGGPAFSGYTSNLQIVSPRNLPRSLDWRNYQGRNFVTSVKHQRGCGSCWAHALTAQLESMLLISQRSSAFEWRRTPGVKVDSFDLTDLSEQTLVSCASRQGCRGETLATGGAYIVSAGLNLEGVFRYRADELPCPSLPRKNVARAQKWASTVYTPETYGMSLQHALNVFGPLTVVFSVHEDFYHYRSGVYRRVSGRFVAPHAVLLVGYDDDRQFFIAKNSWGTDWGENGYFRIAYSEAEPPYSAMGTASTPPPSATRFGREALMMHPAVSGPLLPPTLSPGSHDYFTIVSPTTVGSRVGQPFRYQIVAVRGDRAVEVRPTEWRSYEALYLPEGLAIDRKTGLISGTPTVTSETTVVLRASTPTTTTTLNLDLRIRGVPSGRR